jgi:DNA-binding Lrp family transcriptional regulator
MLEELDAIDRKILRVLQEDAGLANTDLAERVGLSSAPCWRRVKRLEDLGIISRRVAILNPEALGLEIVVFASVKLARHDQSSLLAFENAVKNFDQVTECYTVSGGMDFLLRIVTTDMRSYEKFLREHILQLPAVTEAHSRFVVTQVKYTTALPLDPVVARSASGKKLPRVKAGD